MRLSVAWVAWVALAACAAAAPSSSLPAPSTSASASSASSAVAPSSSASSANTPGAHRAMRPPIATELAPQLEAIGLDPKNLPPITKLAPEQLRKVMPLIAKSLGAKCSDCHNVASDGPQQRTARMNAAEQMWNHFVRGLTTSDGEPIFCDSCHHGSFVVLDRIDPHALEAWMKENFVGKLARADQKEHTCATCHGSPMRPRFIDSWKTR